MIPSPVCDYPSALEFLLARVNYERTTAVPYRTGAFKLDRMRRLLAHLGDPHLALKAIHIAGTKGKGSTAAMLAAVLQAAGLRTGLYTSPHLDVIEERIALNGQPCERDEFVRLAAEVEEAVARLRLISSARHADQEEHSDPTFFEVTTAMAFLYYARQGVDAAVLEVGLGGRLDSTNVCLPSVTIITSISYDHTRQLGGTLAAIAGEKAGIIKAGVPVVSGVISDEPREVIRQVAREQRAPLLERGAAFDFDAHVGPAGPAGPEQRVPGLIPGPPGQIEPTTLDYREPAASPTYELRDVRLAMLGRHQAANAAAAIAATRQLIAQGWSIDEAALRHGLAAARARARIEVVSERPTVIVDVAHNVASIEALLDVLASYSPRRRLLIFASSKDKDTAGMLRLVMPQFDEVVLTRYIENPRAVELAQLAELAAAAIDTSSGNGRVRRSPRVHAISTPAEAWGLAQKLAGPDDLVCIAGSFFLAAELRPLVMPAKLGASK